MSSPTTATSAPQKPQEILVSSEDKRAQFTKRVIIGIVVLVVGAALAYVIYKIWKYLPLIAAIGTAGLLLALGGPELLAIIGGIATAIGAIVSAIFAKIRSSFTSGSAEEKAAMDSLTASYDKMKESNELFESIGPDSSAILQFTLSDGTTVNASAEGTDLESADAFTAFANGNADLKGQLITSVEVVSVKNPVSTPPSGGGGGTPPPGEGGGGGEDPPGGGDGGE
jgi:hypothetical protein